MRAGMNLDAVQDAKPKIWAMICHRVVANKTCKLGLKTEGGTKDLDTDIFKNLKAFFAAVGRFFNFICHQELLPNVCENELHGLWEIYIKFAAALRQFLMAITTNTLWNSPHQDYAG